MLDLRNPILQPSRLNDCYDFWEKELELNSNRETILEGIKNGFNILEGKSPDISANCPNYKSATTDSKNKVEAQIICELNEGNYCFVNSKPKMVSSIGAVPKSNGSVRLIHDLSHPFGGVNSFVDSSSCSFLTVDNATALMKPNCFLAKVDLRSAYRSVPIHPSNYTYTGISWKFSGSSTTKFMVDCKLPFGAKKACQIFQSLSNAVARSLKKRNVTVINYLDDILIISDSRNQCWLDLDMTVNVLTKFGFQINWNKVSPPSQSLDFLGVAIDTRSRTLSLPTSKLSEMKDLVFHWLSKRRASKRDILKFLGKLNWCARVVRGGRTFMRRLIDLSSRLRSNHHRTWLSTEVRKDILWWHNGLKYFHGDTQFIQDIKPPKTSFTTDACPIGGGGFFGSDWFFTNFEQDFPDYKSEHINVLELLTVLVGARRWGHLWRGMHIRVFSDNSSTVYAINKGASRSPKFMRCLRELFWLGVIHDFRISAVHVKGVSNVIADTVSRLNDPMTLQKFVNMFHSPLLNFYNNMSIKSFLSLPLQMVALN